MEKKNISYLIILKINRIYEVSLKERLGLSFYIRVTYDLLKYSMKFSIIMLEF